MILKYILIFILNTELIRSSGLPSQKPPGVGKPLILTPYIEAGKNDEARKLSQVDPLLPGSNITSYSGFFTVDKKNNSNLFMWFFQHSSTKWYEAPLVLWLQGGPGFATMYSVFQENGPFTVIKGKLEPRKWSWTTHYNVLYIDQPVGTGFSFTDSLDYNGTQELVADHLYKALTQFFKMFPELKKTPFYTSGESYAGRYIPAISYNIHTENANASNTKINLKGLFLVSAMLNALQTGLCKFCYEVGIIDSKTKTKLEEKEKLIEVFFRSKMWRNASDTIDALGTDIVTISNVTIIDYTSSSYDALNTPYVDYLQTPEIRSKIHVGNVTFINNNEYILTHTFREDFGKGVVPWVEELIDHYRMLFVGGQFDLSVAHPVVSSNLERMSWKGAFNYSKAERKKFISDGKVVGYIKSAGNLIEVLMRNAGHMVPYYQPQATLDLLKKFINNEL